MPKMHDPSAARFTVTPRLARFHRAGFTLAELLVVIGIIALLVSILVPVVGRVRISGQRADTAALIRAIDAACQTYYSDHMAYPGPLADAEMGIDAAGSTPGVVLPSVKAGSDGFYRGALMANPAEQGLTGSENLVLGLLGGLVPAADDGDPTTPPTFEYDPAAVGRGPVKLGGRSPGASQAYFDGPPTNLSMHVTGDSDIAAGATATGLQWGRFVEEGTAAGDSIIPEFIDRFSDPLPILYMRARPTGRITPDNITVRIVADAPDDNPVYLHTEIDPYVASSIGAGKSPEKPYYVSGARLEEVPGAMPYYHGLQLDLYPSGVTAPAPANLQDLRSMMDQSVPDSGGGTMYTYPYDARAYLLHPSQANARQADRYVLISAGPDRTYGTEDDITNFGSLP